MIHSKVGGGELVNGLDVDSVVGFAIGRSIAELDVFGSFECWISERLGSRHRHMSKTSASFLMSASHVCQLVGS